MLPWVPHAIAAGKDVLARVPVVAILSSSPPVASHLAAMRLKLQSGIPWIADLRDPLWGNPFRNRRCAGLYDAALEYCLFSAADAVIANTDPVASLWRKRYPRWAHKFHVIMNGYDPEDDQGPQPIPPRPYSLIVHVGSLYGGRRPGPFLASVDRLIGHGLLDPNGIQIRLIGPMEEDTVQPHLPPFATLAARGCLKHTPCLIPADEARRETSQADYLLLLDLNGREEALQVPAKLFEYIRVGRPILAFTSQDSPVEHLLNRSGVPHAIVYENDSDQQTDAKVLTFLQLSSQPVSATSWFWETFDARRQTARLATLLDGV
jgi:glycosyltransferase involved in cell wall biosynthesis